MSDTDIEDGEQEHKSVEGDLSDTEGDSGDSGVDRSVEGDITDTD